MSRIEVTRGGTLSREVWRFEAWDGKLVLDEYEPQERRTTRHKWNRAVVPSQGRFERDREAWKRRAHNSTVHYGGWRLPAAEVPFPLDVLAEAKKKLLDALICIGPTDPKETQR